MAPNSDDKESSAPQSQWKTEGHPWVDTRLQVACSWAVPTSKSTSTTSSMTGNVVAFGPVDESKRKPALGRVIYEPPPQAPVAGSMPENVVLALDLTGTEIQQLQAKKSLGNTANDAAASEIGTTTAALSSSSAQQQTLRMASSFPSSALVQNVQERYQTRLEQYMHESILPPLVALAALEEATLQFIQQRIAQEDAEHAAKSRSNNNGSKVNAHASTNPHPPLYYWKPPNQYLTPPSAAPTSKTDDASKSLKTDNNNSDEGDPTKEHLSSTPSAWLARIKLGSQQAYNEYLTQVQHEQQLMQLYTTQMMQAAVGASAALGQQQQQEIELSTGRRSSSRIARIATEQWEQQKEQMELTRQRQTRSAASHSQTASSVGVYLKGHRIASFLQTQWELEQNQIHPGKKDSLDDTKAKSGKKEQTATNGENGEDGTKEGKDEGSEEEEEEEESGEESEEEDEEDMDLFNPHLQPTYGDVLKCLRKIRLEDIQSSLQFWCQETTNRTSQKVRKKQLEEEDEMENVLEVDVLPLDSLILGIPEEGEGNEEAVEEEKAKDEEPAEKMEVDSAIQEVKEEESQAKDTEPNEQVDKMEVEPTTEPVKSETEGSKKLEAHKRNDAETTAATYSKIATDSVSEKEAESAPSAPKQPEQGKIPPEAVTSSSEKPADAKAAATEVKESNPKTDNGNDGVDAHGTPDEAKSGEGGGIPTKKHNKTTKTESTAIKDKDIKEEQINKKVLSSKTDRDKKKSDGGGAKNESVILQWEVPSSVEKAPSMKQVHKFLQSQDHTTFGRYKFALRRKQEETERLLQDLQKTEIIPDEAEVQRQLEEQAMRHEAERAFKNQKVWDKWRFEGIHGGYAVWPRWQDAVKRWQADRNAKQGTAAANEVAAATDVTSDSQIEADRAKALELAQKEQEEETAASGTSRRTTRRKANPASSSTVFYGQSSQLTGRQLVELILRLCSEKSTAPTILHLQSIVAEDGTQDPVRRLRPALGKLVWRRNQLARLTPSTDWTDKALHAMVKERPLLQIAQAQSSDLPPAEEEKDPAKATAGDATSVSTNGEDEHEAENQKAEEEVLIRYIQRLHQTELQLRKIVLDHLTEIPIAIVATAADERKNSNEGYDSADFEDQANIEWTTEGHQLIGKHIFRPRQMENNNDLSQCEWFTIKSYVPSVPCENAPHMQNVAGSTVKESPVVDRRMRFRAAPFVEEDEGVEFEAHEFMVLTEAQVRAGMKAADLEQVNMDREVEEEKYSTIEHPFAGSGLSAKITLYPVRDKGSHPIHFTVVGHDSIVGDEKVETVHRILVLAYATESNPSPVAVWATLDVADDTEMRCRLKDDPSIVYRIQQSDFHPESEAFAECRNIVNFLENHPKAIPFLEPVDPVALNIPDYSKVITNPMDISTLSEKLEKGHYSNIPPKQTAGRSPAARMLNGPFRADVELIFDNAMLFNPPKDWIHEHAAALKKAVLRKIDQASNSADVKYRRSGRNQEKRSIYLDEDSDVDMYEYESDHDDDDDFGRSRRKRKRGKGGQAGPKADDNSTRAMEQAVRLQKILSETLGLRGPFANFRVDSDPTSFALPPGWSCRRKKLEVISIGEEQKDSDEDDVKPPPKQKHEEELSQLVELTRTLEETDASGLRRSTRTHAHEENGKKRSKKTAAPDFEYFTLNELEAQFMSTSENLRRKPAPRTRPDVEYICEKLHESYYSGQYKKLSELLEQSEIDSFEGDNNSESMFGSFANGSFPPYLGRMVPVSLAKHGKFCWEIRAPFQIPALRWVIRGLLQSGHIGEIEPLEQDNISSGVLMTNHVYYTDSSLEAFEVLDTKELARRRRANNEEDESSDDEVELSEYEQLRAERVARNKERLKFLGLA